jgi:hypothetical protein
LQPAGASVKQNRATPAGKKASTGPKHVHSKSIGTNDEPWRSEKLDLLDKGESGKWLPWVLELGAKHRRELCELYELRDEAVDKEGNTMKHASRRLKQNRAQQAYMQKVKDREGQKDAEADLTERLGIVRDDNSSSQSRSVSHASGSSSASSSPQPLSAGWSSNPPSPA